jgi:2,4-diketo-3-deoxy-L-fuconate hydrolase
VKIARLQKGGFAKPCVQGPDGLWRDASAWADDWTPATVEVAPWEKPANRLQSLPQVRGPFTFAPPISRPGKIVCIGLNYTDHAKEAAMPVPTEPVFFLKATTSWCGPDEDVAIPPGDSTRPLWPPRRGSFDGGLALHRGVLVFDRCGL